MAGLEGLVACRNAVGLAGFPRPDFPTGVRRATAGRAVADFFNPGALARVTCFLAGEEALRFAETDFFDTGFVFERIAAGRCLLGLEREFFFLAGACVVGISKNADG